MARDNLSFFTVDGLYNETPRPPSWFEPYTAIGFTIASVVASFIYMLILDFKQAYIDVPKYLVKPEWFVRFGKSNVKAPLIEVNPDGDYREALARGSRLVGPRILYSDTSMITKKPDLVSRQTISYSFPSQRMGNYSIQHDRPDQGSSRGEFEFPARLL